MVAGAPRLALLPAEPYARQVAVMWLPVASGREVPCPAGFTPIFTVLLAVLIAGSFLTPGRPDPAAAQQASPVASTPCPATTTEENKELVRHFYEDAYGQGHLAV